MVPLDAKVSFVQPLSLHAEAQPDVARRLGGDPLEAAQRAERNLAVVRRRLAAQTP